MLSGGRFNGSLGQGIDYYKDKSADELFDLYAESMSLLVNSVVPLHEVRSRVQLITPWFDDECRRIKRHVRLLERRYRRTRAAADKTAWIEASREKHRAFKVKENTYWEVITSSNSSNPRKLWRSMSALLGERGSNCSVPSKSFTAANFLDFLEEKVESVRRDTANSPRPTFGVGELCFLGIRAMFRGRDSSHHPVITNKKLRVGSGADLHRQGIPRRVASSADVHVQLVHPRGILADVPEVRRHYTST